MRIICATCGFESKNHAPWCMKVLLNRANRGCNEGQSRAQALKVGDWQGGAVTGRRDVP